MTSLQTRLFGLLATSWGILLIYFYHSSRVHKYLAPDFHHLILFGGIGITILGTYSLINPKEKKSSCDHDHHDHDHHHDDCGECQHDHQEGHGPLITTLLTIAPLAIAMNFTQDKLSNTGLSKKGLYEAPNISNSADLPPFTREDLEKRVPRNEHGEFELRMITAYYASGDHEIQDIFDGLPIQLEGRIAPEKINNESGNRMRIFRSIITCCAADLQVIGISMEFPEGSTRPADQDWVKAGGILTFETIGDTVFPLLKVREVIPAEEPYSEFRLRQ